ncbi:KxYKxGKxW signal peptide domain-containing protein [Levilactobacillus cerevisiae]|uniref:KxYKxGKxW signal peptide domain-containing protein n=1 Tax=Levilactobacillus cerevisiae TaxID=1704076 RepID=UPI000F76AE87|nr:KxYKxGKxW signal peptide domain-containing protein [Levilactobacillus cerevisiae]
MRNVTVESKEHYKSYKAGKHWVFACITVLGLGLGMAGATTTAQADATGTSDAQQVSTVVTPKKTLAAQPDTPAASQDGSNQKSGDNSGNDVKDESSSDTSAGNNAADSGNGVQSDDKVSQPAPQADTPAPTNSGDEKPAGKPAPAAEKPDGTEQQGQVVANPVTPPTGDDKSDGEQATTLKVKPQFAPAASLLRSGTPSIAGVDASVWMPDANLRSWIEGYLNNSGKTVTDANLADYAGSLTTLYDGYGYTIGHPTATYAGPIQSLEGLQYFTKLTNFDYYRYLPASAMIDFSFAPNLTTLNLKNRQGVPTEGENIDDFFSNFANNHALQYITVSGYGLTGGVPNFSQYADLKWLQLQSNQLTGDLANLGTLPNVTSLELNDNQLTGVLPSMATLPSLTFLQVDHNQLTSLPADMASYTGYADVDNNNLTVGLQNRGVSGNILYQTVTGKNYTITPTVRSFDPITDVISGVIGADGQIDLTDPMVAYDLGTPGDLYFTVAPDPDNPVGFKIVAADDTPDGTYTLGIWNTKTHAYNVSLTFTVTNGKDAVVPATGSGTGTTTTTTPETPTGTPSTPETTVINDGGADQVVTGKSAQPITGGDGAQITTQKPTSTKKAGQKVGVLKATVGQASPATKSVTKSKGQAVNVVAPKALANVRHQQVTAKNSMVNTAKTTLPQTSERSSASLVAAGIALAVGILGLGIHAKRHE